MKTPSFDSLKVGEEIPALITPPVTRHTLALYCGASGDHNPIHVDIDFAKSSGLVNLANENKNPLYTSTYGTGIEINDAIEKGVKEIFIGIPEFKIPSFNMVTRPIL